MSPHSFRLRLVGVGLLLGVVAAAAPGRDPAPAELVPLDRWGEPLPNDALARLGSIRFRHPPRVEAVCFDPTGKLLATTDGLSVRVWQISTGLLLARFGEDRPIDQLTFSPSGKVLATAARKVRLWDAATGKETAAFDPMTKDGIVRFTAAVRFSSDGRSLAAVQDTAVSVWDVEQGKMLRSLTLPLRLPTPLAAFSPDLKLVVVTGQWAGFKENIHVWDTVTKERVFRASVESGRPRFSTDGKVLAADLGPPGNAVLWQVDGWKSLPAATDGQFGLSTHARLDGLEIYDAATRKRRFHLKTVPRAAQLTLSPNGAMLAAVDNALVRLFDVARDDEVNPTPGHTGVVTSLDYSPAGDALAASDGELYLWDCAAGQYARLGRSSVASYSPDGKKLAAAIAAEIVTWDATGTKVLQRAMVKASSNKQLVWASKTRLLVVCFGHDHLLVQDGATGDSLFILPKQEHKLTAATLAGDGSVVAVATADQTIQVWDVAKSAKLRSLTDTGKVTALSLSSTGLFLVAGADDGHIDFWDVGRGLRRFRRQEHAVRPGSSPRIDGSLKAVTALRFSPDGFSVASGAKDGQVIVWEALTGQVQYQWAGPDGGVTALAFSSRDDRLASAASDTSVLLWSFAPAGWRKNGPEPSPTELGRLWDELASQNARDACRAQWLLGRSPDAVSFLRRRLHPVPALIEADRLRELLAGLDSDRLAVRTQAAADLAALAPKLEPALRRALSETKSVEVRKRLETLLEKLPVQTPTADELRCVRAIQILLRNPTPEAHALLKALAAGDADALQTRAAGLALRQLAD